jgi:hypothetical protein
MKRWLAACALALATAGAAHAEPGAGMVAIQTAPAVLKADRGYILMRVDESLSQLPPASPVFQRKPLSSEVADYEAARKAAYDKDLQALTRRNDAEAIAKFPPLVAYPFSYWGHQNLFRVWRKQALASANKVFTYLLEVEPTSYVVYGATISNHLDTCNCLGTVGFAVAPGVVTDIGTVLLDDAEPLSAIPELASTTNMGKPYGDVVIASAIRPATADTPVPPALAAMPRVLAKLHAVAPFVEPGADTISRIAPIPGVLHYEKGRPVDDGSGQVLR